MSEERYDRNIRLFGREGNAMLQGAISEPGVLDRPNGRDIEIAAATEIPVARAIEVASAAEASGAEADNNCR